MGPRLYRYTIDVLASGFSYLFELCKISLYNIPVMKSKKITTIKHSYGNINLKVSVVSNTDNDQPALDQESQKRLLEFIDKLYETNQKLLKKGSSHLVVVKDHNQDRPNVLVGILDITNPARSEALQFKGLNSAPLEELNPEEGLTQMKKILQDLYDSDFVGYISHLIEAQEIYKSKNEDLLKKQDLIFNLIEAYPGMKRIVDGVENKTLTYEDLMLIMADIPHHMKKAYEVWYGSLMD